MEKGITKSVERESLDARREVLYHEFRLHCAERSIPTQGPHR